MPKPFRIAMIPTSTDGVNYYRLAAWAFEMRKYRNVLVDLLWFKYSIDPARPHPWQEDFHSMTPSADMPGWTVGQYVRGCINHACEQADIVVWHPVHYAHTYDFFLEMMHKHQKPFVVEVDDNFIDVPPWNEAHHSFKSGSSYRQISLSCIREAEAVIASTPHLKETYAPFNENIYVVENSLDFKGDSGFVGWDQVSTRKHRGVRLGWIGGRSHFEDLMLVAPVLQEILRKYPDATLCLVNSALKLSCEALGKPYPFEGFKNVHYADRSVAINRYAKFMASFGLDIGIAPLVDCNFNRSKSNLRWLEYSALKIPTVASSISHFSQSIQGGKDGFLVKDNDPDVWMQYLESFITLPHLREEVGRNAYGRVKTDFNIKRNAPGYIRLLKKILESKTTFADESLEEVAA